jgi:hypothetical protein
MASEGPFTVTSNTKALILFSGADLASAGHNEEGTTARDFDDPRGEAPTYNADGYKTDSKSVSTPGTTTNYSILNNTATQWIWDPGYWEFLLKILTWPTTGEMMLVGEFVNNYTNLRFGANYGGAPYITVGNIYGGRLLNLDDTWLNEWLHIVVAWSSSLSQTCDLWAGRLDHDTDIINADHDLGGSGSPDTGNIKLSLFTRNVSNETFDGSLDVFHSASGSVDGSWAASRYQAVKLWYS